MNEGLFVKVNWMLFKRSIIDNLSVLGVDDPKNFYKKVRKTYKSEMQRLSNYGKNDVLKVNLTHAVMLGAIYEHCNPKPNIDAMAKFYHDFMMQPKLFKWALTKSQMLKPSNVMKEVKRSQKSQNATHPYTWKYTVQIEDKDRFTATFTKCGIYEYLRDRGTAEIVPAMCALDYTFGEVGNHYFIRKQTIATGGTVCDCHYVNKSVATQKEIAESEQDKIQEAVRGGQ